MKIITRESGSMLVPVGAKVIYTRHRTGGLTVSYERQRCPTVHINGKQCTRQLGHKGGHRR